MLEDKQTSAPSKARSRSGTFAGTAAGVYPLAETKFTKGSMTRSLYSWRKEKPGELVHPRNEDVIRQEAARMLEEAFKEQSKRWGFDVSKYHE